VMVVPVGSVVPVMRVVLTVTLVRPIRSEPVALPVGIVRPIQSLNSEGTKYSKVKWNPGFSSEMLVPDIRFLRVRTHVPIMPVREHFLSVTLSPGIRVTLSAPKVTILRVLLGALVNRVATVESDDWIPGVKTLPPVVAMIRRAWNPGSEEKTPMGGPGGVESPCFAGYACGVGNPSFRKFSHFFVWNDKIPACNPCLIMRH
jgi:hypothetical protein